MNRKVLVGVGLGATVVALILLLYFFYPGFLSPLGPMKPKKPETASLTPPEAKEKPGAPGTTAPAPEAKPQPPAAKAAAPSAKPATKPETAAPAPKEAALPALEPKEGYGLLARSYRGYHSAGKLMEKLKKQGHEAFIRRDGKRYQVWVGPFSTRQEAARAAKSIKKKSKISPKIAKLVTPVPK
jgi:cell division septation protein DedD